jgi:hypothetical protein
MVRSAGGDYGALVNQVWDDLVCFDRPDEFSRNFRSSPVIARTLFAAHWCQSEVCNGGFWQFFWNSTGSLAPEAEEAFRSIGMPRTAGVVSRAMEVFPKPFPRDREQRWQVVPDEDDGRFDALDNEFFDLVGSEAGGFQLVADAYSLKETAQSQ